MTPSLPPQSASSSAQGHGSTTSSSSSSSSSAGVGAGGSTSRLQGVTGQSACSPELGGGGAQVLPSSGSMSQSGLTSLVTPGSQQQQQQHPVHNHHQQQHQSHQAPPPHMDVGGVASELATPPTSLANGNHLTPMPPMTFNGEYITFLRLLRTASSLLMVVLLLLMQTK